MSRIPRRAMLGVALAVGLASCGSQVRRTQPATTLTAYSRSVAAKDSFSGRIVHATGGLAGDGNTLEIDLQTGAGSGTRAVSVTLSSSSCRGRRHCLRLDGKLKGTLTPEPGLADRGRTFRVSVSGTVKALAHASATGTVTGTGNVRFGHESLSLTVSSRAGKVILAAQSAQVPGFTTP